MKNIIVLTLLLGAASAVRAQTVSNLQEDFNAHCTVATGSIPSWRIYNPIAGTLYQGSWTCAPSDGRPTSTGASTPGLSCTNVYGSPLAYNLDTSYFVSPLLNLSSWTGHVYLHFDSKVSRIHLGGETNVIISQDSNFHDTSTHDVSAALTPIISLNDSSGWVTHELDLTPYKSSGNFYIAFRYVGSATTGSVWYLDNIATSATRLNTPELLSRELALTIIGQSTSSQITVGFTSPVAAQYRLSVSDMLGRVLYRETIPAAEGAQTHAITGLSLAPGMYCVHLSNGSSYSVARVVVQ